MPIVIEGLDTQQKLITVANNDAAVNAEIQAQSNDVTGGWLLVQYEVSGTDLILFFQRNVAVIPT